MLTINLDRDDKNADWLHSLKRKNLLKSKVYLKPQEKPPEGVRVQRGPRGGQYYETQVKMTQVSKIPEEHIQSLAKFIKQIKIPKQFDSEDRDLWELQDNILEEIQKTGKFNLKTRQLVKKMFSRWDDYGYQSTGMSPMWIAASHENGKKNFPSTIVKYLQKHSVNKDTVKFLRYYIKVTKMLMYQKFDDNLITVYRGVKTKNHENLREMLLTTGKSTISCRALESWTPDKHYAEGYADTPHSFVIKMKIHPLDVGYIGALTTPIACGYMDANEFTINTSKKELNVSLVYDYDKEKLPKELGAKKKEKEREKKKYPWFAEYNHIFVKTPIDEIPQKLLELRRKYPSYEKICVEELGKEPLK